MFSLNKKSKKASEKFLSLYWFAIILLVAVGIFSMVYIFYSAPYEVRDIESEILAYKVGDCVSSQGIIHPGLMPGGKFNENFNILRECGFNFQTEDEYDWRQEEQYFAEISVYNVRGLDNYLGRVQEGNLNWKGNCFIKDKRKKDYERFVKCSEKRIYVLGPNSEQYLINILVGVGKIEKNAHK